MKPSLAIVPCALALAVAAAGQERRPAAQALEQIRVLEQEKEARTPAQRKMDSRLLYALYRHRGDVAFARLTSLRVVSPDPGGRILVDIDLVSPAGIKPVIHELRRIGAVIVSHSARFKKVRARVPILESEALAQMKEVRRLAAARPPILHKINTSEGDAAHRAAAARGFFGVDGSGVKVCVLSDGIDSLAAVQASGDLPAVDVLPGQAGTGDEGTAMLEIVHDLAPLASLGFATAFSGEAQFAQNILDLRNLRGCQVLVDDVLYLEESPFQDGVVADAVNTVTAGGALYFSSAGNEGNQQDQTSATWEGDFHPNGTLAGIPGTAHDFGDGGQTLSNFGFGDAPYVLHWADPMGASGNDYDLFILDFTLTTVVDSSTNVQNGNDDPFEATSLGPFPGDQVVVVKRSGAGSPMFNLFAARSQFDPSLATGGATRGHSAVAAAFSVAAVDATTAGGPLGAFDGSESVETFSSDGPRRIFFSHAGALLPGAPLGNFGATGGVVRQKPDVAAADGVSTATPGFAPFYGTSAAAPHAAAVAALVKQAFPAFTPVQIRAALVGSALDIAAPGTDRNSGAGIVMAYETLAGNGAVGAASLRAGAVATAPVTGDGDAFVEPNESFSLSVALSNAGGAGASAISATLATTTPGVTVTAASSAYPALAPSGSAANLTPFAFTVGPSLACATAIQFTLTVTYTGGVTSPVALSFAIDTGQPGAPVTVSYAGPAVAIPDALGPEIPGPTADVPLTVSGVAGLVRDINFRIGGSACTSAIGATTVGITHSFVEDLVLELRGPSGQTMTLLTRTGEDGNNFCQTLLDDEAPGASIQGQLAAAAPFTGSFKPALPLASFRGTDPNGTWHLRATDFFEPDAGTVRAFSLILTPTVCDAPPLPNVSIGDVTIGEGNSGSTNAIFAVSLSSASSQSVSVGYSTANGTATAGSDYTAGTGTLTFAPGITALQVSVPVIGDTTVEPDETFFVNLAGPSGANIADGQGQGTIQNDDSASGPGLTLSTTTATPGQIIQVTVASGPGNPKDWVGLHATAAADTQLLDWKYLSGTRTAPATGLSGATVNFTLPTTPGTYNFRFFQNNGYTKLATSATVTVAAGSTPSLTVSTTTATPGQTIQVTVANGPGNPKDWVGMHALAAADSVYLDWKYLSGTRTAPITGLTGATITFTLPTTPGTYNFRFFQNNALTKLATSATVTVAAGSTPTLSPSTTTAAPGQIIQVTVANGPGNVKDWVGLHATAAADTQLLDWKYLSGTRTAPATGLTGATLSFTLPNTPGTYDFRLFQNNTYTKLATSVTVTVAASATPTLSLSTTTATPGQTIQVTVANGPGNAKDWVGLHAVAAADAVYLDWKYLSGTRTAPATGLTGATVNFTLPTAPGTYNFRFFQNNTYTKLATSATVTVQ